MLVSDVMSSNPVTIRLDNPVITVDEIMSWAHVRHVPVLDADDEVVGVVSQRDLLRVAISDCDDETIALDGPLASAKVPVRRALSPIPVTIDPRKTVQEAAAVMHHENIGCLPVTEGGRLIGIVTDHDLLGVLASLAITPY